MARHAGIYPPVLSFRKPCHRLAPPEAVWQFPPHSRRANFRCAFSCCRSSVVEHLIGNEEVECSIHSGSTTVHPSPICNVRFHPKNGHSRLCLNRHLSTNFSREPPFVRTLAVVYGKIADRICDSPQERFGGVLCWLLVIQTSRFDTRSTQTRTRTPTGHGMANRLTTAHSTKAMRRWRPAAIVTLAAMAVLTALTAGAAPREPRPAQPKEATAPREAGEPIMAIVSIKTQQVTFYDAEGWIFRAPVSTGVKERETPAGVFAVIEKEKDHHSTMYDDAWMPNMQRITWNGIALHGGPLPGYAASHGCIRMPYGFAEKLYDKTRIGMRIIICAERPGTGRDFPPGAIHTERGGHRGCAGACRAAGSRGRGSRQGGRRDEESRRDSGARDGIARIVATQAGNATRGVLTPSSRSPTRRSPLQRRTKPRPGPRTGSRRPRPRPRKRSRSSTPPRPTRSRSSTPLPPQRTPPRRPRPRRPPPPRPQARRSSRSNRSRSTSAARRRSFTCDATRISRRRTGAARCSMRPLRFRSRSAIPKSRSARMCSPRWRARTRAWTPACAGPQSRSTTADDAKDALDRITIPQDVLDRIGPTALPRSSIVVSDEPLSAETNYRTEFVAVLSNQPQGGFITREPSTETYVANDNFRNDDWLRVFSARLGPPNWQCPLAGRLGLSLNATWPAVGRGKPPLRQHQFFREMNLTPNQPAAASGLRRGRRGARPRPTTSAYSSIGCGRPTR